MISLAVDGSPSGCRQAARDLRVLRARLTTLADEVAVVRTGSTGGVDRAGRRAVPDPRRVAGDRCRRAGRGLATVATALDTLAYRLDGVRAAITAPG